MKFSKMWLCCHDLLARAKIATECLENSTCLFDQLDNWTVLELRTDIAEVLKRGESWIGVTENAMSVTIGVKENNKCVSKNS